MDDIKREELKKACKKIHKVRARMVAVCMVRAFNMPVEDTAGIQVRCTDVSAAIYCHDGMMQKMHCTCIACAMRLCAILVLDAPHHASGTEKSRRMGRIRTNKSRVRGCQIGL